MRYLVQGVSPITKEWFQLYASDVKKNAEAIAAVGYVQAFFEDVRVIDTEEDAVPEFLYET